MTGPRTALAKALDIVTDYHPAAAVSPIAGTYWTEDRVAAHLIDVLAKSGWELRRIEAEAARIDPERLERVMHDVVCFYPTHDEPDDPCIGRSFAAAIAAAYGAEP